MARRYALTKTPADILRFSAYPAPTHHSRTYRAVEFVTLEPALTRAPAATLRHLAAVAEMRHLLGAPVERWQTLPWEQGEQPDAVWESPVGLVAVEYDAGSYSPATILRKAHAFEAFQGQVWGSSSPQRVAHLHTLLPPEIKHQTPPLLVIWW
jgi:hypothetical protein